MKVKSYALRLLVAVLLLSLAPTWSNGQEAKVRSVTATTSDGLAFSAWVKRPSITSGEDITIYYSVDNRSGKPIYLVRSMSAKTMIDHDSIIFPRPFVPLGGHEEFDYSFVEVAVGEVSRGQLKVSREEYKEAQLWKVNVGFGYVNDITGLNPLPDQSKDPAPYKAELSLRLQTLLMADLIVEVKEPSSFGQADVHSGASPQSRHVGARSAAIIRGVVFDRKKNGIANATVVLENSSFRKQTISAEVGHFFVAVPAGRYRLVVAAQGFKQRVMETIWVRRSDDNRIKIQLQSETRARDRTLGLKRTPDLQTKR
jgi:hypothetical protein